jgi:short-subunit dehydrogenase
MMHNKRSGMQNNSIIITGATSGIGRELAKICVQKGYKTGGTGRRVDRLIAMKDELGDLFYYKEMDVTRFEESKNALLELADDMGGADIIVLNAGISNIHNKSSVEIEQKVIDVNVSGFVQLFNTAYHFFEEQGHGQIVGISSIAAYLGYGLSAPYNASKAFISNYMQGYRQKARRSDANIIITDIKPGFAESEMTEGQNGMFWVSPTDVAARQILKSIEKRKSRAYVTRRWRLIAWLIHIVPNRIIDRI